MQTTTFRRPRRWAGFAVAVLALIALSLVPFGAVAQDAQESAAQEVAVPEAVQPGERLKISVFEFAAPGAESWFIRRVDDQGRLELPLVGVIETGERPRHELEEYVGERFNRTGRMRQSLVVISRLDHGEDHVLVPTADPEPQRRP